jgi:hypothetical protein
VAKRLARVLGACAGDSEGVVKAEGCVVHGLAKVFLLGVQINKIIYLFFLTNYIFSCNLYSAFFLQVERNMCIS